MQRMVTFRSSRENLAPAGAADVTPADADLSPEAQFRAH